MLFSLFSTRKHDRRFAAGLFLMLACCGCHELFSQTKLRIIGNTRVIDIENHTELKYRKKGNFFFDKSTLINMRDSTLFFSNGDRVKFAGLAALRIKSKAHLPREFQKFFFYAGFGLIPLSMLNDVITGRSVELYPGLVYVSAGAVAAGGLIMFFRTKRIHIGRHKVLRIIQIDYENLAAPAPGNGP